MKFYMFEGTPEELSTVLPNLNIAPEPLVQSQRPHKALAQNRPVTAEEAREVLTRLGLSDGIRQMLRTLYAAGLRRLTTSDLKKVTKKNGDEFRGMVGAFGRRLKNSVPIGVWFWDQKWDSDLSEFTWSLPESVRQALRELKLDS